MPKKIEITASVFNVDGKDIHVLTRPDGKAVTSKQIQDYVEGINVNECVNRHREINEKVAQQREALRKSEEPQPWKCPPHQYREFMFDLQNGLMFCTRKYKTSKEFIVAEAKRIAPDIILRR